MDPFLGQIVMFGGNFAPRGWALCDGQLLPISSYSALFSILGTTYGGDGRTTFALPDLRGRAPLHAGHRPGLSTRTLGQKSGAELNYLNVTQLPAHNHTASTALPVSSGPGDTTSPVGAAPAETDSDNYGVADDNNTATVTVGNTGGNQPVNNMQPFLAVNYIIALQGTYPSRS